MLGLERKKIYDIFWKKSPRTSIKGKKPACFPPSHNTLLNNDHCYKLWDTGFLKVTGQSIVGMEMNWKEIGRDCQRGRDYSYRPCETEPAAGEGGKSYKGHFLLQNASVHGRVSKVSQNSASHPRVEGRRPCRC